MQRSKRKATMKQHNNIEYSKGFTTTSSHSCGFTLIELLVVIAVVGILAAGILVALDIGGIFGKADIAKGKRFAQSLESGLIVDQVGKWSFEESSSPSKDSSRYKRNANWSAAGVFWKDEDACGLGLGGCLDFDGTDGYVETSKKFTTGDAVTFSFWFDAYRVGNGGVGDRSCAWLLHYLGEGGWYIEWRNNGLLELGTHVEGVWTNFVIENSFKSLNSWNHLAGSITRNGPVKVYLNGDSKINDTIGNWQDDDTFLLIGSGTKSILDPNSYNQYCKGLMDEVSVYSEALTLSQIRYLFASGLLRHQLAKW